MQDDKTYELDKESFFARFPRKAEDAHKGSSGKILIVTGGWGMAGAACLNILGAKALGAGYILAAVPEDIYGIVAANNITPVYYPYSFGKGQNTVKELMRKTSPSEGTSGRIRAVSFGSGAVDLVGKYAIFDALADGCMSVLVLDAEALHIMAETGKTDFNKGSGRPVIITPHYGEFSELSGMEIPAIKEDPLGAALAFSEKHNVVTVLKGPGTVVAAPDGRHYINRSGNRGLAQAGSGDVLTGMITAMCSFKDDPFEAACMAVFAHGMAADELAKEHSLQCLPIEDIPAAMDRLFKERGF